MRKLIAVMNMTLDGFCDHTLGVVDEDTHQHYADLLNSGETILYGRKTYELMAEYWPTVVNEPTGDKATDNFAIAIDKIQKVVFSNTLKTLDWGTASLATKSPEEETKVLKNMTGGDIQVGSPSLIIQLLNAGLVDELQIAIHPIIAGKGLSLFEKIRERIDLELLRTKNFNCGVVAFYYRPSIR
ncbi:MAG: dihydrofolate reductase [Chitinophagaceae bacterium]|nr:MAG: dihydrofolate reductase [Chitinophagaceae bacterium]